MQRDLARWSGLALRRRSRGARGDRLRAARASRRAAGARTPRGARRRSQAPPRLLGAFDPLLLGWCSREPIVGRNKSLVTVNGVFRPFALARGRAVARWRIVAGEVELEPFERLTRADAAALREEADDVLRYLAIAPASARRS